MNPVRFIPKPLVNAQYAKGTVNLYKTIIRDPSRRHNFRILGWEKPSVRIANTITWLLQRAKKQGLATRQDGFVRVQELLQHPRLASLDFFAIEKAVHRFRAHYLRLVYAPQNISSGTESGTHFYCWWIGLQQKGKRKFTNYENMRVLQANDVPYITYKAPSQAWPSIRDKGIPRGNEPHISFNNNITIPFHYTGDETFIQLNSNKIYSNFPLYTSGTTDRRRGNKTTTVVNSPASIIPPSMIEAAMRVAVKRIPLILRPAPINGLGGKGPRTQRENETRMGGVRIMQEGIDALRKHGFADVMERSRLGTTLQEQCEQENAEECCRGSQK